MGSFIHLVEQIAPLLYLALLAGVLWSLRSAWIAWRDSDVTLFALERETSRARARRALLSTLSFIGIGVVVYLVAGVIAPALPSEAEFTATPPGPLLTQTPTDTPFPTPTLEDTAIPVDETAATEDTSAAPIDTPTPAPTSAPAPSAACPDPNVQITAPGNGQTFSGAFQIFGTANIENFSFYKFDVSGPATNFNFTTINEVAHTPVVNNYLGTIDPLILLESPGAYQLSLVAVDNVGNEAPHCTITIVLAP
jgi:hypothetical protein